MTAKELYELREWYFTHKWHYSMQYYKKFDFANFTRLMYVIRPGKESQKWNDVLIMADTETSKKTVGSVNEANHVVAFTVSVRAFHTNIVTLYGYDPAECVECLAALHNALPGDYTSVYFHNMAYDYVFLRQFLFLEFGLPTHQLNVKQHYPIYVEFENGLIIRDSLILAQKKLEKWGDDLNVEHKKACGKWDYDKVRNQHEAVFTAEELEYIEHDTLCGVECLDKTKDQLKCKIYNIPYTATGIPRGELRNRGREYKAHDWFKRQALSYNQYIMAEKVYHGGFTHANRHYVGIISGSVDNPVKCFDFASSYPFILEAFKMPCERFMEWGHCDIEYILERQENYAFMFRLVLSNVRLKDWYTGMPCLQFSKCESTYNAKLDNGRVLKADAIAINITEQDLAVIVEQYDFDNALCDNVNVARKDYLPRWFTDYVYELFTLKTQLKGSDDLTNYQLRKAALNSMYGLCCMKNIKEAILEDYSTGLFTIDKSKKPEEIYDAYIGRYNTILPYQIGVWVTAYAFRNLFRLGACCGTWLYSDTDSCYGYDWDMEKVNAYNENCKRLLQLNGYGPVMHKGREYWLGVAEHDGLKDSYSEYVALGAKRYCGRNMADGKLHITVAGVPKSGADCLDNNIKNFKAGMIFPGIKTGKLTHYYIFNDGIYKDKNGNLTADSIDLAPCDYLLDSTDVLTWDELMEDDIEVNIIDD